MASYNRVILMGNLTRDPELRTLPSGMRVAKLGLAVSESWRDRSSGERRETTCFVDVEVWDKLAELCGQYLSKGRPILVEGRLRMDEWTNKEGERRTKLLVRADGVKFVGPASQRADGTTAPGATTTAAPAAQSAGVETPPAFDGGDSAADDENLPF